jgi:hypothetical protein
MQVANSAPTPELVGEVLRYRRILTDRGLAPSTINTRLAAIKSLVSYARKVGECHYDLADVDGVKVETYRDTSGVNPTEYQGMIGIFDRDYRLNNRSPSLVALQLTNSSLVVIINPNPNSAVDNRSRRSRRICLTDPKDILLTAIGKFQRSMNCSPSISRSVH